MKNRLLILVGFALGMVMMAGCVPPTSAEAPAMSEECSTHEDCYFKALVHKCMKCTWWNNGVAHPCREAKKGVTGCMEWAHKEIKEECEEDRTGMGNLCGPPPEEEKPMSYRDALILECMNGFSRRRVRCTMEVQQRLRKECSENPAGMGDLCGNLPPPRVKITD